MALCGEPSAARRVADEASQRLPNNTVLQAIGLPLIRAAIELASDRPAKAIEALAPAAPYERGWPQLVYLRGLAYLRLNDGARAAAEFHRILDHWGAYFGPFYPQSYAGLARAEALRGGTAAARKAYEDFFAFWKDADADIPLLIEARNEYAALKEK